MKLLLVHAYFLRLDPGEQKVMKPYPPLGLLYLSAFLKRAGHDVRVFDGTFARPEDLAGVLASFQPDALGFYANMMTRRRVLQLRESLDQIHIPTVVGGPDPPHYAESYLARGFDAVIVGEGERPLSRWLDHCDQPDQWGSIEGLVFRSEGRIIRTPAVKLNTPLDQFPLPDRKAIDLDAYLDCWQKYHGMRPISLITSRGCPYRCTWCSHNVYGHSLRKRSPSAVLEEMDWLHRNYRFDHYWFADDVFTIKPSWVFKLRDLLAEQPHLIKPFECISRADRLTPEMVTALRDMACFRLWVGAESGSQRLLDLMKRGVTRAQVSRAMGWLKAAKIQTGMFFMWGFMDETFQDVLETVSLAAQCQPDIALTTIAYPIKGTGFHKNLQERDMLRDTISFEQGSDRNIQILGQPGPELYRLANVLLHIRLSQSRLRRGSFPNKTKAVVQGIRAWYFSHKLKKAFHQRASSTEPQTAFGA